MGWWKKCGTEIPNTAMPEGWVDGDKTRKIFVLRTQTVADPGSHAGAYKSIRASMDLEQSSAVRFVRSIEGFDKGQAIDMFSDLRKQIAYPGTRLTILSEFPGTAHEIAGLRKLDAWLVKG